MKHIEENDTTDIKNLENIQLDTLDTEFQKIYAKNCFFQRESIKETMIKRKPFFDMLSKVYPQKENLNHAQKKHLFTVLEALSNLDKALKPLRKYDLNYSLDITGGAIYDFLTNKTEYTKDIDVIFALDGKVEEKGNLCLEITKDSEKKLKNFNALFLKTLGVNRTLPYISSEDLNALLMHLLNNHYNQVELKYDSSAKVAKSSYINNNMFSLISINDKSLCKPVDLIVAKNDATFLVYNMDFNICKVGLNYRRSQRSDEFYEWNKDVTKYLEEKGLDSRTLCDIPNFDDNVLDIALKRMYLLPASIYDLYNKTCTLDFNKFSLEHINHYVDVHYPRIKEKLSDYPLNFYNEQRYPEFVRDYNIKQIYNKIEQTLEDKDNSSKKLKL